MSWINGITETDAYYQAFWIYDIYETIRLLKFNEGVAVFIARNRITHWYNGNRPNTRPEREPFHLIVPINTIRDAANVSAGGDVDALNEAIVRLRALPAYSLYVIHDLDEADRADAHNRGSDSPHRGSNDDNDGDQGPPPGSSRSGVRKAGRQGDNDEDRRVLRPREGREQHSQRRRERRRRMEQDRQNHQAYMAELRQLREPRERHERAERELALMARQGSLYGGDNRIAFPGQPFPMYQQQFGN